MSSAREIADGLSEKQRDLLLRIGKGWGTPPRCEGALSAMRGWAGRKKGLLESKHDQRTFWVRLSPLGLEVRSILQEKQP